MRKVSDLMDTARNGGSTENVVKASGIPEEVRTAVPESNGIPFGSPFSMEKPDYVKSPYTGMTRDEWIRCGIYILEGAFQYVDAMKTPMFLPKFPGKSYPSGGNENATPERRNAAIFEALARTFNVAAPLLSENPELTVNGIKLIDYYNYHLLRLLTDPECDYYIGSPGAAPFQPTCELGNLSMWNLMTPEVFWNRLSRRRKTKSSR